MRIGIDVDNTITDTLQTLRKYCTEFNEKVVKRNLKMNERGYNTSNIFDWSEEENMAFCKEFIEESHRNVPLKECAKEIIKKLKDDGHEIFIITARHKPYFSDPYTFTKEYLDRYNIVYDKLEANCTDKLSFCKKHKIELLVDDEPQNIKSVSTVIPVIVFEGPQNADLVGTNIIKVNHWNKVYDLINKLNKKDTR